MRPLATRVCSHGAKFARPALKPPRRDGRSRARTSAKLSPGGHKRGGHARSSQWHWKIGCGQLLKQNRVSGPRRSLPSSRLLCRGVIFRINRRTAAGPVPLPLNPPGRFAADGRSDGRGRKERDCAAGQAPRPTCRWWEWAYPATATGGRRVRTAGWSDRLRRGLEHRASKGTGAERARCAHPAFQPQNLHVAPRERRTGHISPRRFRALRRRVHRPGRNRCSGSCRVPASLPELVVDRMLIHNGAVKCRLVPPCSGKILEVAVTQSLLRETKSSTQSLNGNLVETPTRDS